METEKNIVEVANEYIDRGLEAFSEKRLSEAASIVSDVLQLLKGTEEWSLYAKALNILGVIYAAMGNETMAIDCYLDGLDIAEEHDAYDLLFLFYNNIGSRYQELGNHEKAIYYFRCAEQRLEVAKERGDERYPFWCVVNSLNLTESHCAVGQYEESESYLKQAEQVLVGDVREDYIYSFMLSKAQLYLKTGRQAYIYENLENLFECALADKNNVDFVQNMTEACSILLELGEYEYLKKMIGIFDDYAKVQGTVFYRMTAIDLWIEYYKALGEDEEYHKLCVERAELRKVEQEMLNQEKIAAIDTKIELRIKEAEKRRAENQAMLDPLTGLWNRLRLRKDSVEMFARKSKREARMAIGVLDIDCFKAQNDTYGHVQGDRCLREVADIMRCVVGDAGEVYRYGGDEFVILLGNGDEEAVKEIAASIGSLLRKKKIANENSVADRILTVSQGYVSFVPEKTEELVDYLRIADQELYQVKERGRNDYSIVVKDIS